MSEKVSAKLVFATNNIYKIEEAKAIIGKRFQLISLKETGFDIEVEETGDTFEANALQKAQAVFDATGLPCVADDSGLCVDALDGAPGIYSGRYAGQPVNHQANNLKLLEALQAVGAINKNRTAEFVTVLCVVGLSNEPIFFRGSVKGEIIESLKGNAGFGYDPLFRPIGETLTFGEMLAEEKNALSHRGRAFENFILDSFGLINNQAFNNGVPPLRVSDYDYELPDCCIAMTAVEPRDSAKLLYYNKGGIEDRAFSELDSIVEPQTLLVANNTKVIPARLFGETASKHQIEIFLLTPLDKDWLHWEAMIGNRRRFKAGDTVVVANQLRATWLDRNQNQIVFELPIGFRSMAEAIEHFGNVPLPPYINRLVDANDKERYQAIFAKKAGAVAAPTASLHFTEALRKRLVERGIEIAELTLHVGAGTFKPMTAERSDAHVMHGERFEVDVALLDAIISRISQDANVGGSIGKIIAIGTTSMRVLESLYYIGVKLMRGEWVGKVESGDPYHQRMKKMGEFDIETIESLLFLRGWILENGGILAGITEIFIVDGFEFRICTGIITNFHQPKSTLLMLVAAFLGDRWSSIYSHSMANGYRFLSYGDGSLLIR